MVHHRYAAGVITALTGRHRASLPQQHTLCSTVSTCWTRKPERNISRQSVNARPDLVSRRMFTRRMFTRTCPGSRPVHRLFPCATIAASPFAACSSSSTRRTALLPPERRDRLGRGKLRGRRGEGAWAGSAPRTSACARTPALVPAHGITLGTAWQVFLPFSDLYTTSEYS